MAAYIVRRLHAECDGVHGAVARVAKATGFAGPTISNVHNGKTDPGEDLAYALAGYWGMTYEQLEQEAARQPEPPHPDRVEPERGVRYRDRPEWNDTVELARLAYDRVPSEYFERVGDYYDEITDPLTAGWVGQFAKLLHERASTSGTYPTTASASENSVLAKKK